MEHKPSPAYVAAVLAVNFEDCRRFFTEALLEIHTAHTLMLARQKILSAQEARICLDALCGLDRQEIAASAYDGRFEDFFFFVEHCLEKIADPATVGRIHTARSRNDIDITLYRMHIREHLLNLGREICALRSSLLAMATAHVNTVMPAYTHGQPAQPTTLAHYLLAVIEFLERDFERLREAFAVVNRSPMGACAITTTGFPIDRDYTAELLGFEGLQRNSFGAIAAVDYVTQTASAIAVCMVSLGRLVQDLLLWCGAEFRFLRLGDGFVQISSIMPQKRNPVALEHARVLASKAFGQAQAVMTALHNTPFADMVDGEDDLQPLIASMFLDAQRAVSLLAAAMADCHVNVERLRNRANASFLTVTELADTLVRQERISFKEAHRLVSEMVNRAGDDGDRERIIALLRELAPEILGKSINVPDKLLIESLDAEHFVQIRDLPGGPGPSAVESALDAAQQALHADEEWLRRKAGLMDAYRKKLAGASAQQRQH